MIPGDVRLVAAKDLFIVQSSLTGESMPVSKRPGDTVIGATINKSGTFRYTATKVGADTALAQVSPQRGVRASRVWRSLSILSASCM